MQLVHDLDNNIYVYCQNKREAVVGNIRIMKP